MTISVFKGKDSLKNFLNPANYLSPLVELPPALNPYYDKNIHIFIKMQSLSPLLNIKAIPAHQMIQDAPAGKEYLVEASSGNTAMSLAVIGKQYGFSKTKAYVSANTAIGKIKSLLLFGCGASVIVEDEAKQNAPESGINRAKSDGLNAKWYNPNQYANESNPKSHEDVTGPQIFEQLGGSIDIFCSGLGTSGTTLGTARYLCRMKKDVTVVSLVRGEGQSVPGPRTKEFLNVVELDWQNAGDIILSVGQKEAYQRSLELCQAGLMAGPSTGFNYAGLLNYLSEFAKSKPAEKHINAVFMACDTPLPYMDDYFKILPRESFPLLEGEALLEEKIFG